MRVQYQKAREEQEQRQEQEWRGDEWDSLNTVNANRRIGDWEETKDPESGVLYYYNHTTGANQWEMPAEFQPHAAETKGQPPQQQQQQQQQQWLGDCYWEETTDPESGTNYYYNHKTGACQWEMPLDFEHTRI